MHAQRTVLYDRHAEAGARFIEFGGWEMPLHYRAGALAEHHICRNSAALFDVSHMTQFLVTGRDAAGAISRACSCDADTIAVGSSSYALLCRDDGGIIDDVFVYRTETERFLIVANAARAEIDRTTISERVERDGASFRDISAETAMLALQGPRAHAIAEALLPPEVAALERFGICTVEFEGTPLEAARTGYTGEDGLELFIAGSGAERLWDRILETGDAIAVDVLPAGLAARDTLRLEAGFALYGHELTEEITPVEARLLWACDMDHEFIGRDAILARNAEGPARRLQRLVMEEGGVPRESYTVVDSEGQPRGTVVSGGRAPTLDRFIANAYVDTALSATVQLAIQIHGTARAARRHSGPYYRSSYRRIATTPQLFDRDGVALVIHK